MKKVKIAIVTALSSIVLGGCAENMKVTYKPVEMQVTDKYIVGIGQENSRNFPKDSAKATSSSAENALGLYQVHINQNRNGSEVTVCRYRGKFYKFFDQKWYYKVNPGDRIKGTLRIEKDGNGKTKKTIWKMGNEKVNGNYQKLK